MIKLVFITIDCDVAISLAIGSNFGKLYSLVTKICGDNTVKIIYTRCGDFLVLTNVNYYKNAYNKQLLNHKVYFHIV
jgi:hypothetical protein